MKRILCASLLSLASIAACGDTSGSGGAGGTSEAGSAPGGSPPAVCFVDATCTAGDEVACVCNGCSPDVCYQPDMTPPIESDCTCPACADDVSCDGCDENGECDPFFERCDCSDCAGFPSCQ